MSEPCGTAAAYRRHLWHGEPTCQPCKDAQSAERARCPSRQRHLTVVKPPGWIAANAARAAAYAERVQEFCWLRSFGTGMREAAERVGVKTPANIRKYEAIYQSQRQERRAAA